MRTSTPGPASPARPVPERTEAPASETGPATRGARLRARLGRLRRVLPEVLYRRQPALLLLPVMILLGRMWVGYDGWVNLILIMYVLPWMLLGQLLFWLLSWRAARRTGRRRLGPSWVPFAAYLAAALLWPLGVGEVTDVRDISSVLARIPGVGGILSGIALVTGLVGMVLAGLVALFMASVPPSSRSEPVSPQVPSPAGEQPPPAPGRRA